VTLARIPHAPTHTCTARDGRQVVDSGLTTPHTTMSRRIRSRRPSTPSKEGRRTRRAAHNAWTPHATDTHTSTPARRHTTRTRHTTTTYFSSRTRHLFLIMHEHHLSQIGHVRAATQSPGLATACSSGHACASCLQPHMHAPCPQRDPQVAAPCATRASPNFSQLLLLGSGARQASSQRTSPEISDGSQPMGGEDKPMGGEDR